MNPVMPGRSAGHPRICFQDPKGGWPGQARPWRGWLLVREKQSALFRAKAGIQG